MFYVSCRIFIDYFPSVNFVVVSFPVDGNVVVVVILGLRLPDIEVTQFY